MPTMTVLILSYGLEKLDHCYLLHFKKNDEALKETTDPLKRQEHLNCIVLAALGCGEFSPCSLFPSQLHVCVACAKRVAGFPGVANWRPRPGN